MGKNDFDAKQLTTLEDLLATDRPDKGINHHNANNNANSNTNGSTGNVNTPVRSHVKHTGEKDAKFSFWRVVHHVHRLIIFVCAIVYIATRIEATTRAFDLLYGAALSLAPKPASTAKYITEAVGTTTLRESPLVKTMLQGDTSPRSGTLFLTAAGYSYTPCPAFSPNMARIYTDAFMRATFEALKETSYNLTFLDPATTELTVPVVDCSNRLIVLSYATVGNFYYLVRNRRNQDDVVMLRIMMSNQDYKIPSQTGEGPAAIGTVTFVSDLRVPTVDHHFVISLGYPFEQFNFRAAYYVETTEFGTWRLRIIPSTGLKEIFKYVETSSRSGFFIKAETEQSNVNTYIWVLPSSPVEALTTSQWRNKPVLRDSWAWVHFLQLLLAIAMISNMVILVLIMYQKLRLGKLWIGDAFVSVFDMLHLRGILVLLSWYMNEFWLVHEFCLSDANTFTQIESITVFPEVMAADLHSIYIPLCGLLGILFKVRVDPFVGFVSFEIAYQNRKAILKWFPSLVTKIQKHATNQYISGLVTSNKYQQLISPMFFWTTGRLGNRSTSFVLTVLFPILLGLLAVLAYIVARKVYRHYYPDQIHIIHSRATATSGNEEALLELQHKLALQNRFGYLAEYENSLFIKGVKHASADGIYSNGFVIANKKFLMQTEDFWEILLMKVLRFRYRNIFVYEIEGTTVKQTARLVYPQTLLWADLFNLNITNLSNAEKTRKGPRRRNGSKSESMTRRLEKKPPNSQFASESERAQELQATETKKKKNGGERAQHGDQAHPGRCARDDDESERPVRRGTARGTAALLSVVRGHERGHERDVCVYLCVFDQTNMFDWHFTLRGPRDTEFEGGMYHGRILLPSDYPFKPPNIMLLTPNGRFEVKKKICLSISAHHPEEWQPAWGVRLILEALISFMPTKGEGAIGALDFPPEERKRLAKQSVHYKCDTCGKIADLLPELQTNTASSDGEGEGSEADKKPSKYAAQIAQLHMHSLEPGAAASAASSEKKTENDSESAETKSFTESETSSRDGTEFPEPQNDTSSVPPAAATSAAGSEPQVPAEPEDLAPVQAAAGATTTTATAVSSASREPSSVDTFLHYFTIACLVALFALVYKKLLKMQGVLQ